MNLFQPQFTHISNVWCELQNNVVKLASLNQISNLIQELGNEIIINQDVVKAMLGNNESLTDAERLRKTTGLKITESNSKANILYPNQMKDFDNIPLQVDSIFVNCVS